MSNKYKIVVMAYCEMNLGDDLFLKMLFERYKNVEWCIIELDNSNAIQMFSNYDVKTISRKEYLKTISSFDAMVNIGGSIFIQTKRWYGLYLKRLFYTLPLKLFGKKVFIMGANFGPFNSKKFLKAYASYFSRVDDICFRDKYSYEVFCEKENVRIAPDIIFDYKDDFDKETTRENSIGISIMNLGKRSNLKKHYKTYLNKMCEIIRYSQKNNMTVHLFSFCEQEGDEEAINDVLNLLTTQEKQNVESVLYQGNIEEFLKTFSTMKFIIALRFHSFILSQVYGQSVMPIIYSDKTLNVLKDINLDEHYITLENINDFEVHNMFKRIEKNYINIESIAKESTKHFLRLDELLKG